MVDGLVFRKKLYNQPKYQNIKTQVLIFKDRPVRNSFFETFCVSDLEKEGVCVLFIQTGKMTGHSQPGQLSNLNSEMEKRTLWPTFEDLALRVQTHDLSIAITSLSNLQNHKDLFLKLKKQLPNFYILAIRTRNFPALDEKIFRSKKGLRRLIKYGQYKLINGKISSIYGWLINHLKPLKILPDYILTSTFKQLPKRYEQKLKREKILNIHTDDYNTVLKEKSFQGFVSKEPYIVFIAQLIPYTISRTLKHDIPIEEYTKYYNGMKKALIYLKEEHGYKNIFIAGHPASNQYPELKKYWEPFPLIINNTHRLIKNSHLVVGHYSTAFDWAVIYNKPIVLITNALIERHYEVREPIQSMKNALGCPLWNIDHEKQKNIHFSSTKSYNQYMTRYIKDNEIKELSYLYAVKKIEQNAKMQIDHTIK